MSSQFPRDAGIPYPTRADAPRGDPDACHRGYARRLERAHGPMRRADVAVASPPAREAQGRRSKDLPPPAWNAWCPPSGRVVTVAWPRCRTRRSGPQALRQVLPRQPIEMERAYQACQTGGVPSRRKACELPCRFGARRSRSIRSRPLACIARRRTNELPPRTQIKS
jgi:hypothetical protein